MERNVGGGAQKRRLQNEEVRILAQRLEVEVFRHQVGFGRHRQRYVQVGADFRLHRRNEVGDVVFRVEFSQVEFETVDFARFEKVDESLKETII